uniref:Putative ionotropic receptor ligand binding domain-containing protein n=1 Tax=Anopheles christyi TaxID=43041 RepID=A0A182K146_9DIPT
MVLVLLLHRRLVSLLLLVMLAFAKIGSISIDRPKLIDRWVSCIGEIVQTNADRFRHELNVYRLDDRAEASEGKYFEHDLLDRLLPLVVSLPGVKPFTINLAPYERTVSYNHRNLVLVLLERLHQLEQHLPALVAKNVEQGGYFLLLLVPGRSGSNTTGEFEENNIEQAATATFRLLWSVRIHNVLLVVEQRGATTDRRVDLLAYEAYGPGCCGCSRPKLLTQYSTAGKLSNSSVKLYDRFERNLYGCQLRIACFERAPFLQFVSPVNGTTRPTSLSSTTRPRLAGIEGSLVELLAAHLNFRIAVVQPTDGHTWGRIYPNGTATGALGLLLDGTVHMTVGGYFPYPALLAATTQTHNYYMADLVLAVPEELAHLSPFEQLVKPFQPVIWAVVAVELLLGFVALRRTATLHFWRTFIGESMPERTMPHRTVARYLLLLWILHSTLLRECYKGSLVGFLTEPNPLNDIHSLEALVQSGYQFAMTETIYHKVFDESSHHRLAPDRVLLIKSAGQKALFEHTIRTRDRYAFTYTREEIIKFNSRNRTDINYRTSDETLLTFHFAMYFKRSSPIAAACDWYIRRIVATGFINRWYQQNLDLRFVRPTLANTGQAEVLQMHHLYGSYLLLLVGLLLSTGIFTLELLWARIGRSERPHYPYLHELKQYPTHSRKRFLKG